MNTGSTALDPLPPIDSIALQYCYGHENQYSAEFSSVYLLCVPLKLPALTSLPSVIAAALRIFGDSQCVKSHVEEIHYQHPLERR